MLAGVRLDLQLKGHRRGVFGIEAVDELDAPSLCFHFGFPSHGSSTLRTASIIGPAGSAFVWTRSMSPSTARADSDAPCKPPGRPGAPARHAAPHATRSR